MPEGQPEDLSHRLRYPFETRWTGILQGLLGPEYRIIEEGLNGRTTMWDDPCAPYRNALSYIDACLETHAPIDLVMIMLGTNDLKPRIAGRAYDSAEGVEVLVGKIRQNPSGRKCAHPKILIISPVAVGAHIDKTFFCDEFGGKNAHEESLKAPEYLKSKARLLGCEFLDAAKYAKTGADAIHLDTESHRNLAEALAEKIKEMVSA
jgi:lysophospholipase L1-like esterase